MIDAIFSAILCFVAALRATARAVSEWEQQARDLWINMYD